MTLFSKDEVVVSWKQVGEGLLTFTLLFGFIYFFIVVGTIRSVCDVTEYEKIWNSDDFDSYDYKYRILEDWREGAGSICSNYVRTASRPDISFFEPRLLAFTIPITSTYLFIFFLVRIYLRRLDIKEAKRNKKEHKDYVTRFLHEDYVPVEEVSNFAVIMRIFITFLIFSKFFTSLT